MAEKRWRVLLVDDDPGVLKMFGKRLEMAGYAVIPASNGEEALANIAAEPPDVIILDIMLPKLNGYEVCAKLKRDPATQHIPVIMFTAKDQPKDHIVGLMLGANAYISKTCDGAVLVEQVRTLLARSGEPA